MECCGAGTNPLGRCMRTNSRHAQADPGVACCRHVDDREPGIRRVRCGGGFRYVDPRGRTVRDARVLRRIRALAIPPAWANVWICPLENGHIQATGRDARGRKQYRYHARFRAHRDETKYGRMIAFAEALPRIRLSVDSDLRRPRLDRDEVLATIVRLLEISLIRVGNEEYARANGSFGLTTLRARHVDIHGSTLRFHFRGKAGKAHTVAVHDRRIARIVQRCTDLPGEVLFQYIDATGERRAVESADVNAYIRRVARADFTAKDFRTWAGTVLTAQALAELEPFRSAAHAKRNVVAAVKAVAERLGNTPSVCRKCYVHPAILDAYHEGELAAALARGGDGHRGGAKRALSRQESAVLMLLRSRASGRAAA